MTSEKGTSRPCSVRRLAPTLWGDPSTKANSSIRSPRDPSRRAKWTRRAAWWPLRAGSSAIRSKATSSPLRCSTLWPWLRQGTTLNRPDRDWSTILRVPSRRRQARTNTQAVSTIKSARRHACLRAGHRHLSSREGPARSSDPTILPEREKRLVTTGGDFGLGYNYTFSPTFLMSVNAGVNRWVETRVEQSFGFPPTKLGLPAFFDQLAKQFPYISTDGMFQLGGNVAQTFSIRNTGSVSLDFTKVRSAHTLTFGYLLIAFPNNYITPNLANFHFPQSMTQGPDPTAANPKTGLGFASFLLGTGDRGGFPQNASPAYMKKYHGWYFEDQWRATPKLAATVGIRYDLQTAPSERFNRLSYFDFKGTNPIQDQLATKVGGTSPLSTPGFVVFTSPDKRGMNDNPFNNFAPRASLAYRVTEKLVARAGFGMFYIQNYPVFYMPFQGFSLTTPYVGTVDGITPVNLLKDPFPSGLISPPGSSLGALTNVGLNVLALGRNRSSPYAEQWMAGFQYAVTPNDSLDVAYVGNHGVKLNYSNLEGNQLDPKYLSLGNELLAKVANPFNGLISASSCGLNQPTVPIGQLLRPRPQYCGVTLSEPLGGSSWYHGATVEYTHRFSHGVYFLASYTVSKFLDNTLGDQDWVSWQTNGTRNFYNLAAEKAFDANDIPQ